MSHYHPLLGRWWLPLKIRPINLGPQLQLVVLSGNMVVSLNQGLRPDLVWSNELVELLVSTVGHEFQLVFIPLRRDQALNEAGFRP